jgi:hypothetical protein
MEINKSLLPKGINIKGKFKNTGKLFINGKEIKTYGDQQEAIQRKQHATHIRHQGNAS